MSATAVLSAVLWPIVALALAAAAIVLGTTTRITRRTRVIVLCLAAAAILAVLAQVALAMPAGSTLDIGGVEKV